MSFRSVIFWAHLSAGITAGIVVFILSVTGVLLTYERQIIAGAENAFNVEPVGTPLSIDQLAQTAQSSFEGATLVFENSQVAPVRIQRGRAEAAFLNPYSGEIVEGSATRTRAFFGWVTEFHRWFGLQGERRVVGKWIADAANLVFLFILISGTYLWLPKIWNRASLRSRWLFQGQPPTSKARDFNWHHVFGFWALVPLILIVATGVVFSYSWANAWVYQIYGEEVPVRGGPPGGPQDEGRDGPPGGQNDDRRGAPVTHITEPGELDNQSLQVLFDNAKSYDKNWTTISFAIPAAQAITVSFSVDTGTGGEPTKTSQIQLNRVDGSIAKLTTFADGTPGQRTRTYFRRLHTGESLGFIGQTLFGLASLAACFLVYTGWALAYRRLLQPLFRKKSAG